ncbi:MAG: hypothetical protein H8E44_21790 [Planctomycetes bacterium]|nr:hypothetical protein [Planctomycetota bacterium]MBL7040671.1 hypothetical protein [Pirellulaceae bacterium]
MVKQWFLMALIMLVPVGVLVALLYSFGKYLWTLFTDRRLYKDLDELEANAGARREKKKLDNEKRLDNGCDHTFSGATGFPPNVCPKCGLEKEKPAGLCDHVWRGGEGPAPFSYCEKCNKQHRSAY